MFMMTTFVAVGISRPTDDVVCVKTDWKENNNKDHLFSGRNRKANGWSTKEDVAAKVETVAGLFSDPLLPPEQG